MFHKTTRKTSITNQPAPGAFCHFSAAAHPTATKSSVQAVRQAAITLNLHEQAIDPDLVGAHSIRAGGAMALKLAGCDDTIIMKTGRWTSLTFLMYIHTQIASIQSGISQKMSMPVPFLNIAAVEHAD